MYNHDPLVDFMNSLDRMNRDIRPDGHSRIRKIMGMFWIVHMMLTITMTIMIIRQDLVVLMSTFLVILQLYITKIFESLNRIYDKAMIVQSNMRYVRADMIDIAKRYATQMSLAMTEEHMSLLYIDVIENASTRIKNLSQFIEKDVEAFVDDMKIVSLVINALLWKSPEYTRYLEKDAVRTEFLAMNETLEKNLNKIALLRVANESKRNSDDEFSERKRMSMDIISY